MEGGQTLPRFAEFHHRKLDSPYLLPSVVSEEAFHKALTYRPGPDDVFICTYPKCGTTWLQSILFVMKYGIALQKGDNIAHSCAHLELDGLEAVEKADPAPRVIKTHLYYDLIPWNRNAKYIIMARNPKDCFTSFFYHTVGFPKLYGFENGKFDDYFELAINGKVDSGDFFKFVGEWWQKSKTEENVLFLLYEDMKMNPEREILKIADLLGSQWSEKVRANDNELLRKIVESSSFDKMSKESECFHQTERVKDLPFIRKGVIGDWKNLFSDSQSKRVDEKMKQTAEKYPGFDRIWDEYEEFLR